MIKNTSYKIVFLVLTLMILLAGCKPHPVQLPTMNPTELAIAQAKFAYQQQTKAFFLTQTRVAMGGIQLTPPSPEQGSGTAPNTSQTSQISPAEPSLSPTPTAATVTPGQMTPTLDKTMTLPANQSPTFTRTPTPGLTATPRAIYNNNPNEWMGWNLDGLVGASRWLVSNGHLDGHH